MKALKRKDEYERVVMKREEAQRILEDKLKEEAERLRMKMEVTREDRQMRLEEKELSIEKARERLMLLSGLNIKQLISVSDQNQVGILGDLARSQTLKGMSAEEIMAMKDPTALGRALEEWVKNTDNDELKKLYDQIIARTDAHKEEIVRAHSQGADSTERMFKDVLQHTAGQSRNTDQVIQADRDASRRIEDFAERGIDRMGDLVAGHSGRRVLQSGKDGGYKVRIRICGQCKREVAYCDNFCSTCGKNVVKGSIRISQKKYNE